MPMGGNKDDDEEREEAILDAEIGMQEAVMDDADRQQADGTITKEEADRRRDQAEESGRKARSRRNRLGWFGRNG